jgi:hypothetical protein
VYSGSPEARTTYVIHTVTPPGSENGWVQVEIPWANLLRVEWEENAGTPLDPSLVTGFSIGVATAPESRANGTIWLDELSLNDAPVTAVAVVPKALATEPEEQPESRLPNLPCVGSLFFTILVFGMIWIFQRR